MLYDVLHDMIDNQALLELLLRNGKIRIQNSPLLHSQPAPLRRAFSFHRVEGMLLGLAVGDSLGNTSEAMAPRERAARFGRITDYLYRPSSALWADAAIAGMITHNDYGSNACCVAFVYLLWELFHKETAPEPRWWVSFFCDAMDALEGREALYVSRKDPAQPKTTLSGFTRRSVTRALDDGKTVRDACDGWYSGAYLLETMPSALFILARLGNDPEQALVAAVNDTRDNDTIAAVVGAAIGALHGASALPHRWRAGLTGRLGESDDGNIFRLIEQAKVAFFDRSSTNSPRTPPLGMDQNLP